MGDPGKEEFYLEEVNGEEVHPDSNQVTKVKTHHPPTVKACHKVVKPMTTSTKLDREDGTAQPIFGQDHQ